MMAIRNKLNILIYTVLISGCILLFVSRHHYASKFRHMAYETFWRPRAKSVFNQSSIHQKLAPLNIGEKEHAKKMEESMVMKDQNDTLPVDVDGKLHTRPLKTTHITHSEGTMHSPDSNIAAKTGEI